MGVGCTRHADVRAVFPTSSNVLGAQFQCDNPGFHGYREPTERMNIIYLASALALDKQYFTIRDHIKYFALIV